MFESAVFLAAVIAGAIASIAGFGIGSVLTPALALRFGTKLSVAAVSIPHLVGTATRFWRIRHEVDRKVLWSFGLMSAAGGLAGALLNAHASSPALTIAFGVLLIFAGVMGLTGLAAKLRFRGVLAWIAGGLSGLFGGLVGNQGGIRSAALLAFDLRRDAFVATATAIALFVDGARMPVYLFVERRELLAMAPIIAIATIGVVAGTVGGVRVLRRIPQPLFLRVVSTLITILGVYMLCNRVAATIYPTFYSRKTSARQRSSACRNQGKW